ncbi:MAG: hypothetical protein ACFFDT_19005 [Candidatus Hodarchaeota archaeon]
MAFNAILNILLIILGIIILAYLIVVIFVRLQIIKHDKTSFWRRIKGIKVEDRIRLFGGYDLNPLWLKDKR